MTASASKVCQIHLGPRGLEEKTVSDTASELLVKLSDDAFSSLTIPEQQASRKQIRKQLEAARYFMFRDTSADSDDIMRDSVVSRRSKRFSITRDMFTGPTQVKNTYDVTGGLGARKVVAANGVGGGGRMRFVKEAAMLRDSGLVEARDLPDWASDESIKTFFAKVYDKALEEAKRCSPTGETNYVIDSAPGIFLFTEMLKRTEILIREDFTELWARQIFPVRALNTWMPQWEFQRFDTRAEMPQYVQVEGLPSSAPRGSENRAAALRNLAFWHHGASWSNIELMRYAEGVANGAPNIKLDQERINAAVRMMDVKEDLLTFFGDPDVDILGLFSAEASTGIERVASGGLFGAGSTEVDRALLTRDVKQIIENSEFVLQPDTIMLSTKSWLYVNDKRYGSDAADSNQTVLEAAEATLRKLGIKDILWVPEVGWSQKEEDRLKAHGIAAGEAARLAGGLSSQQTMVICKRTPDVMEMIEAKSRVMYPARETVNDRVETRMLQGGGGLAVYKPEAVKIVTNVGPS
jgi:hypothetical protein